jgi:hypothetical protein
LCMIALCFHQNPKILLLLLADAPVPCISLSFTLNSTYILFHFNARQISISLKLTYQQMNVFSVHDIFLILPSWM